ncbi:MAG TPA: nucleoside kinase, partial [Bacillota bacterium]|nr:nucleoside kinase [Bacillota bacterium]
MTNKPEPVTIEVLLPGGEKVLLAGGRTLLEISEAVRHHYTAPIVAAVVENELYELSTSLDKPAPVRFLDLTDKEGRRIYQRSLT